MFVSSLVTTGAESSEKTRGTLWSASDKNCTCLSAPLHKGSLSSLRTLCVFWGRVNPAAHGRGKNSRNGTWISTRDIAALLHQKRNPSTDTKNSSYNLRFSQRWFWRILYIFIISPMCATCTTDQSVNNSDTNLPIVQFGVVLCFTEMTWTAYFLF